MRLRIALFVACMWPWLLLASEEQARTSPLATVASLDVQRYMGTWYEIAKYPNRFQKKCVADTQAEYALMADGRVRVINRCWIDGGQMDEARGVARQVGTADSPKLEVRFAPAWLSFIPAVWGNYWVIDIDGGYELVAVSEPTREYLWVLSREPKVDAERYASLLARLAAMGFEIDKLELTLQR